MSRIPPRPPRYLYKYYGPKGGIVALRTGTLRFTQPTHLNDPFEMRFAPVVPTNEGSYKLVPQPTTLYGHLDSQFGVLSLSEVPNSLLMWAHYATTHSGFLVALDSEHPSFQHLGSPRPVRYTARRPILNASSEVALIKSLLKMQFVKSRDWAYEREWRIVAPLSQCRARTDAVYVKPLDLACIAAVCLGLACTKRTRGAITSALASHTRIRILRARLDSLGYSLVFDTDLDREPDLVFRQSTLPARTRKLLLPFGDGATMEYIDGAWVLRRP